MAEINKLQGDNNPSNDWQIAYLQERKKSKNRWNERSRKAKITNRNYKQAMDVRAN